MKLDEIICEQLAQDTTWPLQGMAPRLIRLRRSVTELEQRLSSLERSVETEDLRQLVLAASSDQLDQENGIEEEWPERPRGEERSQTAPSTPRRRPERRNQWQDVESGDDEIFAAVSPRNGDLEDELIMNCQMFNEIPPAKNFNYKKSDGKSSYMNGISIEKSNQQNSSKYDYLDQNLSNKSYVNKKTLGDITVCESALEELLNEQELIEHEIELCKPKAVSESSSEKNAFSKPHGPRNSLNDRIQVNLSRDKISGEKQTSPPNTLISNPSSAGQCADRCPTKQGEKKKHSGKNGKLNKKVTIQPNKIQHKNGNAPHQIDSPKIPINDEHRKSVYSEGTELSKILIKDSNIPSDSGSRKKNYAASKANTGTNENEIGSGKKNVPKSGSKKRDQMQESSGKLIKEDACQRTSNDGAGKRVTAAQTTTTGCRKPNSIKVAAKPAQAAGVGVAKMDDANRKVAAKPAQATGVGVARRNDANRKGKKKPKQIQFHIICEHPAKDEIFDVNDFVAFLKAKIKVEGRVNNLSRVVTIDSADTKITVTSRDLTFSKRYLKYLSKKYLKKKGLRDWLRVVSPGASAGDSYELRYFKCTGLEDSEDEES